jgi:sulfhydrogenase subunit beta (sulfur reductase)
VIVGALPCDAAAVDTVDKLMGWDYRDELWFGRRDATTIVTVACPGGDASCFCTAVGLAPDASRGSDVLLVPADGGYLAEALTPKGEALLTGNASRFGEPKGAEAAQTFRQAAREKVGKNLQATPDKIRGWLETHFENELWTKIAMRCHGCGACASVCPTCHCFDIVDEADGWESGARRRNWDTCQTARFTVHASGHNPRANQNARFRQRLMHKFAIYPKRFGQMLCTGCGRCARACPGGMDLPELLGTLAGLAAAAPSAPAASAAAPTAPPRPGLVPPLVSRPPGPPPIVPPRMGGAS